MALQDITKPSSQPFYTQSDPAGLINEKKYGLRYDPTTGDYIVQEYDHDYPLFGPPKITWGNDVLYSNGTWFRIATQDSNLFDQTTKNETLTGIALADKIKSEAKAAHTAIGGYAGGNNIHPSALQKGKPSATNDKIYNPNRQPPKNPITSTGPLAGLGSTVGAGVSFVSRNENDLFGNKAKSKGLLVYPATILQEKQDYFKITQFNYEAPYADSLFPRTKDASGNPVRTTNNIGTILLEGLTRGSAKKKKIGEVILPIPEGIEDTNTVSWGADSMNNMTAAAVALMMESIPRTAGGATFNAAAQGLTGVNLAPIATLIQLLGKVPGGAAANPQLQKQITTAIASAAAQQAGFDVSAETILSRGYGMIPNQNMELLFNNVALRQFTFAFKLAPRSRKEAQNVRRIIRFFKQGMAARVSADGASSKASAGVPGLPAGSTSLFLGSPNVFRLQYLHGPTGEQIKGLNRFKTCALTNMTMRYTDGGMYQSFDDGQPAHMIMALSFNELEPVYENDYQANITSTRIDSDGVGTFVREDEIGY